jgi:hypothetical protein
MRMGENLKAVLTRDRHESHAGGIRHSYGQSGRRRYCDDHWSVNSRGFLHHLNRYAACENNNPLLRRGILADEGAGELIERVMAPDILPAQPPSPWLGAKSPRRARHESHDLGPVVERAN